MSDSSCGIGEVAPEVVEFLVTREEDSGYVAWAACASIFTQADTRDEPREMARGAVRCHYGDDAHPVIHLRTPSPVPDA